MTEPKSAFYHLFPPSEAMDLERRSELLIDLQVWLKGSGMRRAAAARHLGVTPPRLADIKDGKISKFTVDELLALAVKAGIRPAAPATS